jgi:hypothetical protein
MKRRHVIVALSGVAALALWFLAVGRSWFVEKCPTCGYNRDVLQFRVLTIPLNERGRDFLTLLQKVAADLGASCTHPKLTRYHKHRYWGLCICAFPCINGTDGVVADISWYDDIASARVREMAAANPSLREEFVERAMTRRDWEFWRAFIERLKALRGQEPHQARNNKSLQATAAAPSVFNGVEDSLLPGCVVAQFPAAVPEL